MLTVLPDEVEGWGTFRSRCISDWFSTYKRKFAWFRFLVCLKQWRGSAFRSTDTHLLLPFGAELCKQSFLDHAVDDRGLLRRESGTFPDSCQFRRSRVLSINKLAHLDNCVGWCRDGVGFAKPKLTGAEDNRCIGRQRPMGTNKGCNQGRMGMRTVRRCPASACLRRGCPRLS